MRLALWAETLAPGGALFLLVGAAWLGTPWLLVLLTPLWFAPGLVRRFTGWHLDERERQARSRAELAALTMLLALVSLLPGILAGGGRLTELLQQEWLDLGFLLLAVFFVRAGVLAHFTLPRASAAHLAGGLAAFTVTMLAVGTALFRSSLAPGWVLVPALALTPHLAALASARLAGILWLGGAGLTLVYLLTAPFAPLERLVLGALLALPWALAAWWSLDAGTALAQQEER